jgi:hypothetical protein
MPNLTARGRIIKNLVMGLVFGIVIFSLAANTYIPFRYAAVMPRSPQPETGRIYRIATQYGAVVYVSKQELNRFNFVRYDLAILSGIGMLGLFLLGTRFGWFKTQAR